MDAETRVDALLSGEDINILENCLNFVLLHAPGAVAFA